MIDGRWRAFVLRYLRYFSGCFVRRGDEYVVETYLFYLSWVEPKSNKWLVKQIKLLELGFLTALNKLGTAYSGFSVSVRMEGKNILLTWNKPSTINRKAFEKMMNEAIKHLEKSLNAKCWWVAV